MSTLMSFKDNPHQKRNNAYIHVLYFLPCYKKQALQNLVVSNYIPSSWCECHSVTLASIDLNIIT